MHVSHVHMHGAAVQPDKFHGPFLAQPSKRTFDKEHPPPWSPPRARPQTAVEEGRRSAAEPEYTAKAPWLEKKFRPATAGRNHEQPPWSSLLLCIARRLPCLMLLL